MPFVPYTIPLNDIISVDGVLWTNYQGNIGPVFPGLNMRFAWLPGALYDIESQYPAMAMGRDIAIQGFGPNGFYDIWRGNEDDLPALINVYGLVFSSIRVVYTLINGCEYYSTVDLDCTPDDAQVAIAAVDTSERAAIEALPPETGDQYLIVTGDPDGDWVVNSYAIWQGASWEVSPVEPNFFTLATNTGAYWQMNGGIQVQIVPPLIFRPIVVDESFTLVSQYPSYATLMNRPVTITGVLDGEDVTIYTGREGYLSIPRLFTAIGEIEDITITYIAGSCSWTAGVIEGDCGTIVTNIVAEANCGDESFSITADIVSVVDFPLGSIYAIVNGIAGPAQPAAIGVTLFGPYGIGDSVIITIENSSSPFCNYVSEVFVHPQVPVADYSVAQAVDASFQGSALPGVAYLVVSDTTGAGNTWSFHVGEIWTGTTWFVAPPASIIETETPSGPQGYWEMVGTVPTQVFPPTPVLFNTVTEIYVASPMPLAPFAAGIDILVQYNCGAGDITIYLGPIEDFVDTGFTALCGPGTISVNTTYFPECPLIVPSEIEQYTPVGEPDPDFDDGGLNNAVLDISLTPDGQMYVGGAFTAYGVTPVGRFTRLNANGSLDTTFNTATGTGFNQRVDAVERDFQNKAWCGGFFTEFNGTPVGYIARINEDGTLDATFVQGTGFNFPVGDIEVQADNKIVVSGQFTEYNGTPVGRICRLNTNGTIDMTFSPGVGFNSTGGQIVVDADQTIIASSGFFSTYNGTPVTSSGSKTIIRIKADGTLDSIIALGTQFDLSTGTASIDGVVIQPDGKLIVTGSFDLYNGTPCGNIIRLEPDGAIDATFLANSMSPSGFSGITTRSSVLPNGQIIVGISPTGVTYNGVPTNRLVRLNEDGTMDTSFNATGPGYTGGATFFSIVDPVGSVIIAGSFTGLDGLTRLRVARIN